MKRKDIDTFEKLSGQLQGLYEEISSLSKKNPNDAVNTFKLRFINKIIDESNSFLSLKYRPFEDFDHFDEDNMPQNSDVVFILSQYLQCFEKFRLDNIHEVHRMWYWNIDDSDENKKTSTPRNLK